MWARTDLQDQFSVLYSGNFPDHEMIQDFHDSPFCLMFILTESGQLHWGNPAFLNVIYGTQRLTGPAEFRACVTPRDRERFRQALKSVLSEKDRVSLVLGLHTADGEENYFDVTLFWREKGGCCGLAINKNMELVSPRGPDPNLTEFMTYFKGSNVAVFIADPETSRLLDCNKRAEELCGYSPEEIQSMTADMLHPTELVAQTMASFREMVDNKIFFTESQLLTKQGTRVPVEIGSMRLPIGDRVIMLGTFRDISEQVQTKERLRVSERRYRELYEGSRDGYAMVDMTGRIVQHNSTFREMLGYSDDELALLTYEQITPARWHALEHEIVTTQVQALGYSQLYEKEYIRKDGSIIPVELRTYLVRDKNGLPEMMWAFVRDIFERKRAEKQLKSSLFEKEILLKETHHRVKNNLQVISSLLNLQRNKIKDPVIQELLRESQNRIHSMALVHETLYQVTDVMNIEFDRHIRTTIRHLYRSYGIDDQEITIKIQVDDLKLGLNKAIPCSLIINELVSNSLKHAFASPHQGEIAVTMSAGTSHVLLEVRDNGSGLPPDFNLNQTNSMGLTLVRILVLDQLNGSIQLKKNKNNGVTYIIRFPL